MSQQITTLCFFKYDKWYHKLWAFMMMPLVHIPLKRIDGLTFYKVLGSGQSNFNPSPDWSTYALLQVWDNQSVAMAFFERHKWFRSYKKHSSHQLVFYMHCIKSRGLWSGVNPFNPVEHSKLDNTYVAVITRATIKWTMLKRFWDYVPHSQQDLQANSEVLFTAGIGESPIRNMATFSMWTNQEVLKNFAYRSNNHRAAIQQTQALQWYKEELFARFKPYKCVGNWPDFTIPSSLKY